MMNVSEREKKLLQLLTENNRPSYKFLSEKLGVTSMTVRNDLDNLSEKNFIIRIKGGAFPAFHPSVLERQNTRINEKKRIAQAAAGMIRNNDTIMINEGTTTALIGNYLLGIQDVHVVSNSTLLQPYARINPQIKLTIVGGDFHPSTESVVGPIACRELEQFMVRIAFIGTAGFSIENGITTDWQESGEIVKKMAKRAEKIVLVSDSSKYGKAGFVHMLPISAISEIITDSKIGEKAVKKINEKGVSITIV